MELPQPIATPIHPNIYDANKEKMTTMPTNITVSSPVVDEPLKPGANPRLKNMGFS